MLPQQRSGQEVAGRRTRYDVQLQVVSEWCRVVKLLVNTLDTHSQGGGSHSWNLQSSELLNIDRALGRGLATELEKSLWEWGFYTQDYFCWFILKKKKNVIPFCVCVERGEAVGSPWGDSRGQLCSSQSHVTNVIIISNELKQIQF